MSNDGKILFLVYYDDPALLPLPLWLTESQYKECVSKCSKPRKFEKLGYMLNGEFNPDFD